MDQSEIYIIPSLGRSHSLGSLYDARNEEFTKTSIFKKQIKNEASDINDAPGTFCDYVSSDSYDNKFQKMNINGALKLSFLTNLDANMQLKFLSNEKRTNKTVTATLIYKVTTKNETLRISDENMNNYIVDSLDCEKNATHYVTEIKWGGNLFATFEVLTSVINSAVSSEASAQVSLSEVLKELVDSVGANSNFKVAIDAKSSTQAETVFQKCKILFEGDVAISTIPKNMEDIVKLLNDVPNDIRKWNDGKGKQIEYTLKPIEYINKKFNKSLKISSFIIKIDEVTIRTVEDIFEQYRTLQGDFNDFIEELNSNGEIISKEKITEVNDFYRHLSLRITDFRGKIREKLLKVRKNEEHENTFYELLNQYKDDSWKINYQPHSNQELREKIEHVKEMKKAGFNYLDKDVNNLILMRTPNIFVFNSCKNDVNYIQCFNALKNIKAMEEYKECVFYIFDQDFHKTSNKDEKVRIRYYADGKLIYDGYDNDYESLLIKLRKPKMLAYDPLITAFVRKFTGKYRIKNCNNFQYEIDHEAINYHIEFCNSHYPEIPKNIWKEIFQNNNDNIKNWPSIFRKKNKTQKEIDIIKKYVGRWRPDNWLSPFIGFFTRSLPDTFGLWKWPYYARLFFSFEFRDKMKEYIEEYPDLVPEPGFVVYFHSDTFDTFDMYE